MTNQESIILKSLIYNKDYFNDLISKLEKNDFQTVENQVIFESIKECFDKHKNNNQINIKAIILTKPKGEEIVEYFDKEILAIDDKEMKDTISQYAYNTKGEKTPIMQLTEQYILTNRFEREILVEGVEALSSGKDVKEKIGELLLKAKEVLNFNVESTSYHDYLRDYKSRFEAYRTEEDSFIAHPLKIFNLARGGRLGTLSLILGESNIGKTLHMSNWAAYALRTDKNVLYISMEDGDLEISRRVDQNNLSKTYDEIRDKEYLDMIQMEFETFSNSPRLGRLIVQDMSKAKPSDIRNLLDKLKNKEGFEPDLILIDYIGLMDSDKKYNNMYDKYKDITEDIRSIAKEYNCHITSAQQITREGSSITDITDMNMNQVSNSKAIVETADVVCGIFSPPRKKSSIDEEDDDDIDNLKLNKETKQTTMILKSRKVNKDNVRPINIRVFTHYQRAVDFESDKRQYVKKEVKEQMEIIKEFVDTDIEQLNNKKEDDVIDVESLKPNNNKSLKSAFKGKF